MCLSWKKYSNLQIILTQNKFLKEPTFIYFQMSVPCFPVRQGTTTYSYLKKGELLCLNLIQQPRHSFSFQMIRKISKTYEIFRILMLAVDTY